MGWLWRGCRLILFVILCSLMQVAWADNFRLPTFEQVRAAHISSDAILLDRNGLPLSDLRINPEVRRLDWVPLTALTPAMREALLRAEDHRFYEHSGVDWIAFAGAAWQNLWYSNKRGASTLTMQLAGLLDPALHLPGARGARRSYAQKWDQSRAAIELEQKWSKPQILEAYLNLAPFRGDLQGVGAASELLFGVPASQIAPREAMLLAVLLRGPNARPAIVAQRACHLAASLGKTTLCPELADLANKRLDAPHNQPRAVLAPQLARAHLRQPGQRVSTLLDAGMQIRLLAALNRLDDPSAAAVVLDNSTGEVLAWVGAVGSNLPDGVLARHAMPDWASPAQAALRIEQRQMTLASPVPLGWAVFDALDARAGASSWMSVRNVLSAHQPGGMLYIQNGLSRNAWLERAHGLGFESAGQAGQEDVPAEPNLLQLAAAWRAFAASGLYLSPRWLPSDPPAKAHRVWRAETAWLVQDVFASGGTGGWQSVWSGYTADDGAYVQVGNSDRHTLALITHAPADAANLRGVLAMLDPDSHAPAVPEGLLGTSIHYEPSIEPTRREWFLRGTEVPVIAVLPEGVLARISFPQRDGQYDVAYEVSERDRWTLSAETSVPLRWMIDGKLLGEGSRQSWLPLSGPHTLSIFGPSDQVLDSIDFTVHAVGNQPAPTPDANPDQP